MKIKLLLFICSFYLLSTAYAQSVRSLHPLFTEQDAVLIPEIEGLWNIPFFDMTVEFQKVGDNFYLLKYGGETNTSTFEVVFLKIKDVLFLDLSGVFPGKMGDEEYQNTFITTHSLYKVTLSKDSMQLYETNYSWFYSYAMKNEIAFKYEWIKNALLLTLSTDELKSFFTEHIHAHEIFESPISFIRKHADVIEKATQSNLESEAKSEIKMTQTCSPEFPFLDGWFGGDGDVSVPLNSTTTLFIFSDSWVGSKDQHSRMEPGMKMVSNAVAVETCLPNGETAVKYFWNNMYAENPEPIFKTYTTRYNYWVTGAFTIHDNLYVVLEKVGHKPGASTNELFNFSLLGFSLAKITNPFATPHEWNIEYLPLPDFKNPSMAIGASAKLDDYIYFFISRHDQAQVLVRKSFEFIDNPEKPYEYYALNQKWKKGLNVNDMDTLVHGFRTTTVNYHPEMKQWVMICDIKFMDNKIKMRTAPALTGPWSDEIDIYKIPEVTPGNPLYKESNFCYLPRECIQNYDSKKHEMLITYDINNPDFSIINANPNIYTPKVITVQLK